MRRSFLDRLSVSSIVAAILGQVSTVIRHEVEMARQEFVAKVKGLLTGGLLLAIAFSFFMGALLLLVIAGVAALTLVWPLWLSTLVAGGGLLLIALVFLAIGSSKIRSNRDLRPERAVSALRRFSRDSD